jgi:hypothetical protein
MCSLVKNNIISADLGLVYFSGISILEECGDIWGFGVHPILSNSLKHSSPKILYYDEEFLI